MPAAAFMLVKAHEQFIVMIADEAALAPRQFPCRVAARLLGAVDPETALERGAIGKQKAEA